MLLTPEIAAFISSSNLAIDLATRDERNVPYLARGLCCRIAPGRRRVSVILANYMIDSFAAALRATKTVAVVFGLASTHRATQLKGADGMIEPALAGDAALVEEAIQGFAAQIAAFGYGEPFARVQMTYRPSELITVSFTPDAVFDQTPGPKAGAKM